MMSSSREFERVLLSAEDFLRRNVLRPRSARDAQKRRARRKFEAFLRRVRRAGFILAGLFAALVVASLFTSVGLVTWIFAIPTILMIAFLSLFWSGAPAAPAASRSGARNVPLAEMAQRVEDGLVDRLDQLPSRALPAADAIVARLGELQPHLDSLEPHLLAAGDARRLICEHLPRLVDSYVSLPASERVAGSERSRLFGESLDLVAQELDHLLDTCCRNRELSFDTQQRFIETRYREDRRLKGD